MAWAKLASNLMARDKKEETKNKQTNKKQWSQWSIKFKLRWENSLRNALRYTCNHIHKMIFIAWTGDQRPWMNNYTHSFMDVVVHSCPNLVLVQLLSSIRWHPWTLITPKYVEMDSKWFNREHGMWSRFLFHECGKKLWFVSQYCIEHLFSSIWCKGC